MQVFRSLPPTEHRLPCALTIGNFDGVHRGHRALLERVRDAARERGLRACVLTFEPHPREFFAARNPGLQAPTRIATLRDKLQALSDAGIDAACVVHFNDRFASLAPSEFIRRILGDGLRTRWLLIGDDFRFGARRQGDFAALKEAAGPLGFEVHSMPTVADAGLRISSSAVRAALARGQLDEAAHLLGRPYAISGHVVHGRKLGRELGFPTLNVRIPHGRPALAGIFVVKVHGLTGQGGAPLAGVASLGTRPAVETAGAPLLETHVLDWAGHAYGKLVRIEFLRKLRDEAHYDSLDALTTQIRLDADQARAHFATLPVSGHP